MVIYWVARGLSAMSAWQALGSGQDIEVDTNSRRCPRGDSPLSRVDLTWTSMISMTQPMIRVGLVVIELAEPAVTSTSKPGPRKS